MSGVYHGFMEKRAVQVLYAPLRPGPGRIYHDLVPARLLQIAVVQGAITFSEYVQALKRARRCGEWEVTGRDDRSVMSCERLRNGNLHIALMLDEGKGDMEYCENFELTPAEVRAGLRIGGVA